VKSSSEQQLGHNIECQKGHHWYKLLYHMITCSVRNNAVYITTECLSQPHIALPQTLDPFFLIKGPSSVILTTLRSDTTRGYHPQCPKPEGGLSAAHGRDDNPIAIIRLLVDSAWCMSVSTLPIPALSRTGLQVAMLVSPPRIHANAGAEAVRDYRPYVRCPGQTIHTGRRVPRFRVDPNLLTLEFQQAFHSIGPLCNIHACFPYNFHCMCGSTGRRLCMSAPSSVGSPRKSRASMQA